ncbi:hypothetical protein [Microbacterium hominis]|uniref:hypothetical protein n=1 Tax=Microbacterium hominis TaxID=162426 RepID=UPI000768833F|nr:hypothetical protein [Microbacterium hominis]KXC04771.1 hypothetical protein MhomT_14645 [Microbacterium hominis]
MIRFITEYRDRFGVELICRVLRPAVQGFLTSRGYRAAVGRAPSARRLRDDLLAVTSRVVVEFSAESLVSLTLASHRAWSR